MVSPSSRTLSPTERHQALKSRPPSGAEATLGAVCVAVAAAGGWLGAGGVATAAPTAVVVDGAGVRIVGVGSGVSDAGGGATAVHEAGAARVQTVLLVQSMRV